MSWKRHRLPIAGVVFAGLLALAVWKLGERNEESAAIDPEASALLPDLEGDDIDRLEIRRPDEEPIVLEKKGDAWVLTAPVKADADKTAVSTAVDKLDDLEVMDVAATKAAHHDKLEVSDEKAVHVIVGRDGGKEWVHLLIGAYRGGNTMVRKAGDDRVAAVKGSIKYAFNKPLRDWRDRHIVDVDAKRIVGLRFENDHGRFAFERNPGGTWKQAEGTTLERFDPDKVASVATALARMSASDFAPADATPETTGLGEGAATVLLRIAPERKGAPDGGTPDGGAAAPSGPVEEVVLRLGGQVEGKEQFYLQRQGRNTIYVVSKYLADRLRPEASRFQQEEKKEGEQGDEQEG